MSMVYFSSAQYDKLMAGLLASRRAVAALDALPADPHAGGYHEAVNLLVKFVRASGHGEVADAFERARERCGKHLRGGR